MILRLIKVTHDAKETVEASLALDAYRKAKLLSIWEKLTHINPSIPVLGNL